MDSAKSNKLYIITPCYFDAPSLQRLHQEARQHLQKSNFDLEIQFVVIDDSGGLDNHLSEVLASDDIKIISPPFNLGHQGALVYALRALSTVVDDEDFIITLDGDGEDQPADIPRLVSVLIDRKDDLRVFCLAQRTYRKESMIFKIFYYFFRKAFYLSTGIYINTGNFIAYRGWAIHNILTHSNFDLCYSSTFLSLPLQKVFVPCARGARYQGQSKLGFLGLITHGLRMFLPFNEKIAVKGICLSAVTFLLTFFLIIVFSINDHLKMLILMILLNVISLIWFVFSSLLLSNAFNHRSTAMRNFKHPGKI